MKCQVTNKLIQGSCWDFWNSEEKTTKTITVQGKIKKDRQEKIKRKLLKDREIEKLVLLTLFDDLQIPLKNIAFQKQIFYQGKKYTPEAFDTKRKIAWEISEIIGRNYDSDYKMFLDRKNHPLINILKQKVINHGDIINQIQNRLDAKYKKYKNFPYPINLVVYFIANFFPTEHSIYENDSFEKNKKAVNEYFHRIIKHNFINKKFKHLYFVMKLQFSKKKYYELVFDFKNSRGS